jgi:hypothetical protein
MMIQDDDPRLIDGHPSASRRKLESLWVELQSAKLMNEHLKSLVYQLLCSSGGVATYPVETLKETLGATFDSTFNEEKTEITFTVKADEKDQAEPEVPAG